MSRHPLDHISEVATDQLAERYTQVERESGAEGSHPAAKKLFRRERGPSTARTAEFLRIDRGEQT